MRDKIIIILIAVSISVFINYIFGFNTKYDIWKETAIENLINVEKYKSAEKQNMQIVNNMLGELQNVKNDTVKNILKKYGAK